MPQPVIIGIAGGTGSGKTTIADAIKAEIQENITIITQDSYYKSFDEMTLEERHQINFDHPHSFDIELLLDHLKSLKQNVPIDMPVFDYVTHLRKKETITRNPTKIIILEGILIFDYEDIRDICDIKIFVDTDADIRILRRINRDISERGRSLDSVMNQYLSTVRPMHLEFVEPSKRFADIIIPEGGYNKIGIDMITTKIRDILNKKNITGGNK